MSPRPIMNSTGVFLLRVSSVGRRQAAIINDNC
jgi:hypothetical protein